MIRHEKGKLSQETIDILMQLVKNKGWFTPTYKGNPYSYQMLNTGEYAWFSDPYRYEVNTNGIAIPEEIKLMAQMHGVKAETMLINRYKPGQGRLGMHQDKDEVSRAPILSLTIGCSGIFKTAKSYYGEQTSYQLDHGDILVFGGEDRMIYHGVEKTLNNHEIGFRYNFTIRQVK